LRGERHHGQHTIGHTRNERSTAELVLYTTFLLLLLLQLCSKWWIMREIRQPRDVAGLRGELVEGGA